MNFSELECRKLMSIVAGIEVSETIIKYEFVFCFSQVISFVYDYYLFYLQVKNDRIDYDISTCEQISTAARHHLLSDTRKAMEAVFLSAQLPPTAPNDLELTEELYTLFKSISPVIRHLSCRVRNDGFFTDDVMNINLACHARSLFGVAENLHTVPTAINDDRASKRQKKTEYPCGYVGCLKVRIYDFH